jgi:hypothetical protein
VRTWSSKLITDRAHAREHYDWRGEGGAPGRVGAGRVAAEQHRDERQLERLDVGQGEIHEDPAGEHRGDDRQRVAAPEREGAVGDPEHERVQRQGIVALPPHGELDLAGHDQHRRRDLVDASPIQAPQARDPAPHAAPSNGRRARTT